MITNSRREMLKAAGVVATAGLAGCSGSGGDDGGSGGDSGGGDSGGDSGSDSSGGGDDLTPVTIQFPEGTVFYPMWEAAQQQGIFEEEGIDVTVEYPPFDAQVQGVTSGEVETSHPSVLPYINNRINGEDLVTYGFSGGLQSVNALYVRADSEYESVEDLEGQRIGVWSWGSSTVQAFQAVLAEQTGLRLREDFETTTAAPPALVGLLNDGEIDGVINVSGLTITMESQPENYRNLVQLNDLWTDVTGHTLPLTSWWAYSDWYDDNTDVAASLVRAGANAVEHWRNNTRSILEEFGGPASIDNDAKIQVVEDWASNGEVFHGRAEESYVDSVWQFLDLMEEQEFIDSVPSQDDVLRNPF
ncbi:ABC transporter substrate-binding protein [Halobellus captivus]|uniref:ABC transporter substrate-binding protein n=1 Tax=Halobellus captivus TaxID=2592614 RepID=UPI0011A69920|nr:ABC transporter substrate-binding protein [Halobellus captivus]